MPHPLKHRSPLGAAFKEAEDHLEQALRERFRIKPDVPEIKRADRALLATERRAFSGERWDWPELEGVEPLDLELEAWPPDEAAEAFTPASRNSTRAASSPHPPPSSLAYQRVGVALLARPLPAARQGERSHVPRHPLHARRAA